VRYQRVIDHFHGRLDFVQVGEDHHHQPPLGGHRPARPDDSASSA
jgi:hypothetical protein